MLGWAQQGAGAPHLGHPLEQVRRQRASIAHIHARRCEQDAAGAPRALVALLQAQAAIHVGRLVSAAHCGDHGAPGLEQL